MEELVERTGAAAAAGTQLEAARQGDVIILAVPWEAMEEVVGNLGDVAGKVLVDVTYGASRVGADGYMELIGETSITERIQRWAPGAHAVKVSMPSQYLVDQPDLLGTPPTAMIAADDLDDLADIPRSGTPRPCDSFGGGGSDPRSDGGG